MAIVLVPRDMLEGQTTALLAAGFLLLLTGNLIQVFCSSILGALSRTPRLDSAV